MMKSRNKNFTQSVISTLFTKFILIFLKMGVGIITARFLGPAGRGLFYTSVQAPGLINTVGTLSIGEGLIYHIGKGKIKSDQIFGTVFMMVLGFTLVLSIIFYFLISLLNQHFFYQLPDKVIPLLFFLIPATMTEYFSASALRGLKVFSIVNKLTIVTRTNIFIFILISLTFWSADLYRTIFAYAIALTLNALLYFIVLFYQSKFRFSISSNELNNVIRYSAKVHIGSLLTEVEYRLDIFILLFFLNATAVGIYSIGVTIAQILWYVSNSVNTVLFPYLTSTSKKNVDFFTVRVLKYNFFINIFILFGLIIIGFPLVNLLYGTMFSEAYFVFLVLSPGLLSDTIARSLAAWLKGTNRTLTLSKISSVSLVVNILFCIILIPYWGVYGAAISSVISYTLRAVLLIKIFCKISKTPLCHFFTFSEGELMKIKINVIASIKKMLYK
jgi:O-antigen/teichoic acid export membrane protein